MPLTIRPLDSGKKPPKVSLTVTPRRCWVARRINPTDKWPPTYWPPAVCDRASGRVDRPNPSASRIRSRRRGASLRGRSRASGPSPRRAGRIRAIKTTSATSETSGSIALRTGGRASGWGGPERTRPAACQRSLPARRVMATAAVSRLRDEHSSRRARACCSSALASSQ
jgi:hypothetical protein